MVEWIEQGFSTVALGPLRGPQSGLWGGTSVGINTFLFLDRNF